MEGDHPDSEGHRHENDEATYCTNHCWAGHYVHRARRTPATAAPLDKGHFDDIFTETFDCDTVTPPVPTRQDSNVHINFTFNQRGGPNIFPYYRESVSGTNVYTNLDTGGTYTEIFTANSRDHKIVDNGDGTITIFSRAPAASAGTTPTVASSSWTPATSGSPSTSTTTAPPATRTKPGSPRLVPDHPRLHRGQHRRPRLLRGLAVVHHLGRSQTDSWNLAVYPAERGGGRGVLANAGSVPSGQPLGPRR